MADEYATLRAAFQAGATIQAYTLHDPFRGDGFIPLDWIPRGYGYWRDLVRLDGERPMPKFSCHPTRYRVKPEDAP